MREPQFHGDGSSIIREIGPHYRSGKSDLGTDFFLPCLRHCAQYDRASGFFSSSVLMDWVEILPRFASPSEVRIRLLISPVLSEQDRQALATANSESEREALRRLSADAVMKDVLDRSAVLPRSETAVKLFAWLVANDRLVIKFAFPAHVHGAELYHEKYGIFVFPDGDTIAFMGSANESRSGHHINYESVDVYRSWIDGDHPRILAKTDQFEEAWGGYAPGLAVAGLSPETLARIRVLSPQECPRGWGEVEEPDSSTPDGGAKESRWRHQDIAIERFLAKKCGVVEMATGTGKTRVALRATGHLLKQRKIDSVIVCTSGNDLLDQWYEEATDFLLDYNLAFYRHFGSYHESGRFLAHPESSLLLASRDALKAILPRLSLAVRARTLIIHDEVHGFGSPGIVASMGGAHTGIPYRLGLSATPEREYDEDGSRFISEEIGEVVYQFGLEDAIKRGILCEFDYIPLDYELTQGDRERIKKVYALQAARGHAGHPMPDQELYRLIADVYKTAEEKPGVFAEYVHGHPEVLRHTIIFAHTKEFAKEVIETVHKTTPNYSTYFDDDNKDRLLAFGRGELDCLITCHRISQGIDIRHLENVILLSSDRARLETIQRIGRCLRIDPANPRKRARIMDFVRSDDADLSYSADRDRRVWLEGVSATVREE